MMLVAFVGIPLSLPLISHAQAAGSLIVCGNKTDDAGKVVTNPCGWDDVLKAVQAIMTFLFQISVPISAGLFIYAGYLYATAGGDVGKAKQGKEIFTTVAIGFVLMLSGWLIVYTLVTGLTGDSASPFLQFLKR